MTVRTHWSVEHTCGHRAEHDLSDRPADRRAGYVRWLAGRSCRACWLAERSSDAGQWLAERRAAEAAAAADWAAQYRMLPLEGTSKAVPWAERVRHQLVSDAYTALVAEGVMTEEGWQLVEELARSVSRAGWWIDQRESEPADLPELLDAATESDRGTENPFH